MTRVEEELFISVKDQSLVYRTGDKESKKGTVTVKRRGRPRPVRDMSISPDMLAKLPSAVDDEGCFSETLELVRSLEEKSGRDKQAKLHRGVALRARRRVQGGKKR